MSGICGLFNVNGAPVAEADLRAMTAMLEQRGPERTGQWRDGPVGLGHTLLATTPELFIEYQPYIHSASGCAISADVRLDNRQELIRALGFTKDSESIGDAELILGAYLRWGENCPEHLLGDFAVAIWDPRQQRLFAARDHFGLRPLYYHHAPGELFVFGSDPRSILVLPRIPYSINEGRIADFLVPQLEWIDYTTSFFEDVYRLPPGHRAIVTRSKFAVEEYWRPVPGSELGPMTDEDYQGGFLEVFGRAVESRLRVPHGTCGSMLSGGMDSGSVVAVASEILRQNGGEPLPTYSAVRHEGSDCPETRAIQASVSMPSIVPTLVYPEDLADNVRAFISGNEEPFDGEMMILKAIYRAARQDGRKTMLDGAGGDIVLNEGSYIVRLLRQGHLGLALREISGEKRFWGDALQRSPLPRYLRAALVPELMKTALRGIQSRYRMRIFVEESIISHDFAARVDVGERFERMRETFPSRLAPDFDIERCDAIRPNLTAGRERYGRLAAAAVTEARDAFLDKRVVDYCSRLPGRLLMRDGWPKIILREVMADRLPEEVRWCLGKPHLGQQFNIAVVREALSREMLLLGELEDSLKDYVELAALRRAWHVFVDGGDAEAIHSAFLLSVWLRENAKRPVVPDKRFS